MEKSTNTTSLDRALALLEMIEQTPGGLTSSEIREKLAIPKSSYTYLIDRLKKKGYLIRDERTRRYKIGLTPLVLAYGTLREMGFRSVAEPALYHLVSETGLAASIGVLERGRVLLVDRVESTEFVRNAVDLANRGNTLMSARRIRLRRERDIGRELPVHSNALGKALLAQLPMQEACEIIEREGLARITPTTIVSKEQLLAELETIRELGYSISSEEHYAGVRGIGAPIFDANGNACAAVSVTGHPAKSAWAEPAALIERVKAAALSISRSVRR